jgi:16S rRNA (cytosine1402-N4)-methyltransferase
MLSRLEPQGRLIAFDKDPEAVAVASHRGPRFSIRHEGFAHLGELPAGSVGRRPDGPGRELAADRQPGARLFVSQDGPLDMRMDTTRGQSVAEWLATAIGGADGGGDP